MSIHTFRIHIIIFTEFIHFLRKIHTLVLQTAWKTAEESFWTNIGKYTKINDDGAMIMPENTFRLSIAYKRT